jgi:tetratricopeptide (TPR) repeat protein
MDCAEGLMRGTLCSSGVTSVLAGLVLLACATPSTVSAQTQPADGMTATQLHAQIEAALAAGNTSSAAESFQTLVARFPSTLNELPYEEVGRMVNALRAGADGQPRRAALEALFSLGWKMSYNLEPSGYWLELTQMRLGDGDLAGARAAAARITEPVQLIRLYCDRRFDAIVTRQSMREVIRRDAKLEVTQYREAMKHEPRSLATVVRLLRALQVEGNFLEAIALAQTVNTRLNEAAQKQAGKLYDDDGELRWVLDQLAHALWKSGAFEEGAQVMEGARRLLEYGRPNVSQRLNLALMYALLGQSQKALDVVGGIDSDPHLLSPYGMIVLQKVYLKAALQTGDRTALSMVLKYLRQHEADAPSSVIDGFVEAGVTGEADALMRTTLADPRQRGALLLDLQLYNTERARTPLEQRYHEQWQNWANRPEVQSEIAKWGHLDTYPVTQP